MEDGLWLPWMGDGITTDATFRICRKTYINLTSSSFGQRSRCPTQNGDMATIPRMKGLANVWIQLSHWSFRLLTWHMSGRGLATQVIRRKCSSSSPTSNPQIKIYLQTSWQRRSHPTGTAKSCLFSASFQQKLDEIDGFSLFKAVPHLQEIYSPLGWLG